MTSEVNTLSTSEQPYDQWEAPWPLSFPIPPPFSPVRWSGIATHASLRLICRYKSHQQLGRQPPPSAGLQRATPINQGRKNALKTGKWCTRVYLLTQLTRNTQEWGKLACLVHCDGIIILGVCKTIVFILLFHTLMCCIYNKQIPVITLFNAPRKFYSQVII